MSKTRRVGAMVVAIAAAVGLATATTATPAAAAPSDPRPVTTWIKPVKAHKTTWAGVHWTTSRRICGAELRVVGDDVWVGYPVSTGSYTSFSNGGTLWPYRAGYTRFKVRPDYDWSDVVLLRATLTYNTCGPYAVDRWRTFWLRLPVRSY
jgi:hypothetical protein